MRIYNSVVNLISYPSFFDLYSYTDSYVYNEIVLVCLEEIGGICFNYG